MFCEVSKEVMKHKVFKSILGRMTKFLDYLDDMRDYLKDDIESKLRSVYLFLHTTKKNRLKSTV